MPASDAEPTRRISASADAVARKDRQFAHMRMIDRFAIVGLSLSLALAGCSDRGPAEHDVSMPSSNASMTSGLVTNAPLETATAAQTLPVYWLGRSNGDVFLYREFIPAQSADDPIVTALKAMMSARPHDPDFFSIWNSPSRLGASVSAKNMITVDISSDAFNDKVDQGIAERSISQLVYTVTAAAAMSGLVDGTTSIQVTILVDGHTGYNAFGHVPLNKPLTRNAAFVAPIWIIDPVNDATVSTLPLKVTGQAVSPTGSLEWALDKVQADTVGAKYLGGSVSITQGPGELGTFSFNVMPPPGKYQLSVYILDPAHPGEKLGIDTSMVTVTEPSIK